MFIFCNDCGQDYESTAAIPLCIDCASTRLSMKLDKQEEDDDVLMLGLISGWGDTTVSNYINLVWSEFGSNSVYLSCLPKNFSVIPTFVYDSNESTITDPVTDKTLQIGI